MTSTSMTITSLCESLIYVNRSIVKKVFQIELLVTRFPSTFPCLIVLYMYTKIGCHNTLVHLANQTCMYKVSKACVIYHKLVKDACVLAVSQMCAYIALCAGQIAVSFR